jgi:hypothetical protein
MLTRTTSGIARAAWARVLAGALVAALGLVLCGAPAAASATTTNAIRSSDVLVYGGTPAGVIAAYTAARAGVTVILLEPTKHLGGMMSNGLAATDIGDRATVGGFARALFTRIGKLEGTPSGDWRFQPRNAERAARDMLASVNVTVLFEQRILDQGGVAKSGPVIASVTTTMGMTFTARVFIDATYEGDLLAQAGVSWRIGREASTEYGESLAGVRPAVVAMTLPADVPPPRYLSTAPGSIGSADTRVQDSNYRICLTSNVQDQRAFAMPIGYRASDYRFLAAYLQARAAAAGTVAQLSWVLSLSALTNAKFDANASGPLSTSLPGLNWDYATSGEARRHAIRVAHRSWAQGFLYFLRYDTSVPHHVRATLAKLGLCRDEFTDNGNWPRQLYIREGRRMVGAYVLTQADIETDRTKVDVIGIASYRVDAHFVSRWFDVASRSILAEGQLALPYADYAIPYEIITPIGEEATNLLVPVAASASHVAEASLRMEPQYMVMGEAAGEAAAMVVQGDPWATVQTISVTDLQARLAAHGAILTLPPDRSTTGSASGAAAPRGDPRRRL